VVFDVGTVEVVEIFVPAPFFDVYHPPKTYPLLDAVGNVPKLAFAVFNCVAAEEEPPSAFHVMVTVLAVHLAYSVILLEPR
jgi:hypothetical protein